MLYEVFAEGKRVFFFFTHKPFGTEQARKLLPNAKNVAVKYAGPLYYEQNEIAIIDKSGPVEIGKILESYIKREVENARVHGEIPSDGGEV